MIRDIALYHFDEQEAEAFALWAFGENYNDLNGGNQFVESWNKLHKEAYEIFVDSQMVKDALKMIELYKDYCDK